MFGFFIANFFILMQLGAKHVESPFIEFGQISTFLYFFYFIGIVPAVTLFNNTLVDLHFERLLSSNSNSSYKWLIS